MKSKSEVHEAFQKFLARVRPVGTPESVRSDDGKSSTSQTLQRACLKHSIKRELTTGNRPQFNGVERAPGIIQSVVLAGCTQTPVLFPGVDLPHRQCGQSQ